ncbi:MAG: hypothetical protein HY280_09805 [Nitrospinae bacterium]|nr:hypothetical protein [Nitrospinota bacterium]
MGGEKFQKVELHRLAPAKPERGAPCNGCGVCCAVETCPVARVFLFQFKGKCRALTWREEPPRYVCGMAVRPDSHVWIIPGRLREMFGKFFASRISAGTACDCTAEVVE